MGFAKSALWIISGRSLVALALLPGSLVPDAGFCPPSLKIREKDKGLGYSG